ncbi:MAG TPA: DUF4097 family beta strand repeat-containing protein [Candidatus Hydrogenedentes bacterium]|nr:DUF4097 family beta strand repeat-containing protein [Candidatus Hydrogenedentota bacterium]
MKKNFTIAVMIAVAIQIFSVGILAPRLPREVCRPEAATERFFSLEPATAFRLINADGSAQISSSVSAKKIAVKARIRAYTATAEGQVLLEKYLSSLFQIQETPELTTFTTEPIKRPDPIDLRVDYTIEVPQDTDLSLEVSNGNIWVSPGVRNVSITANNADIQVLEARGDLSIKTINGRIHTEKSGGESTLESINGSIQTSLTSGTLQASTTTGNILTTLLDNEITTCDLTSLNGSITLVVPENPSAEVNAVTLRGIIRADLPMVLAGGPKRRELYGTLGDGYTNVSMNSMNGSIVIQRNTP